MEYNYIFIFCIFKVLFKIILIIIHTNFENIEKEDFLTTQIFNNEFIKQNLHVLKDGD